MPIEDEGYFDAKYVLEDQAGPEDGGGGPLVVRVRVNGGFLELFAEGYGTDDMEPGYGPVVSLDWNGGKLQAVISHNIRRADPKVISLQKALEWRRLPEPR